MSYLLLFASLVGSLYTYLVDGPAWLLWTLVAISILLFLIILARHDKPGDAIESIADAIEDIDFHDS
ncbi:MAG: hypothetical protein NUW00_00630 [Candidatus Kaiserbacteria bacterium]|nr:hypothetical protein [Candidatus Kaiserbacteria bacterium]